MTERLDKWIASQTGRTRSEAVRLIRSGRVTVNGAVCRDAASKWDPTVSTAAVDGTALIYQQYVYYMLNKPAGWLCVSRDPKAPTVVDLLPTELRRRGLFPVGRLDKDTVGLVLLTDDGEFGHRVLSPKNEIVKCYRARLDGPITAEHCRAFAEGITLADGTVCRPAALQVLEDGQTPLVEIRITEGRYHQIKRMFGVIDRGVDWLKRMSMGELVLDETLAEGENRPLTENERNLVLSVGILFNKNKEHDKNL